MFGTHARRAQACAQKNGERFSENGERFCAKRSPFFCGGAFLARVRARAPARGLFEKLLSPSQSPCLQGFCGIATSKSIHRAFTRREYFFAPPPGGTPLRARRTRKENL